MLSDQCISVTDLRVHTKDCLEDLQGQPKYIFINNKPVAVLLTIEEYEENFLTPSLVLLPQDQMNSKLRAKAKKVRNLPSSQLVNIPC